MKQHKLSVGVIGGFQTGKSTLVNCLLDGKVARTGGKGIAVTAIPTRYTYGQVPAVQYLSADGDIIHTCQLHQFLEDTAIPDSVHEVVVTLWKPLLQYIDLIDTPGFKANEKDSSVTEEAMQDIDLFIVLLNNRSLDSKEVELITTCSKSKKPFLVLVNCINQGGELWDPASAANKLILSEIEGRMLNTGCRPVGVNGNNLWSCNLIWHWYGSGHHIHDDKQQIAFLEGQINFFTKNFLAAIAGDGLQLAGRSHFIAIRQLFEREAFWGFPLNFLRWNSQLNKTFNSWENNLRELVNAI